MDASVVARYEQARLPRYTSYPTAPHFSRDVDAAAHEGWLRDLPAGAAASLYLHVPFCAELCLYCGCHTTVTRRYGPVAAYADLLAREIDLVAAMTPARLKIHHLHWGGGTPTILKASDFKRLSGRLRDAFRLAPDAEVAVEIDPRTMTPVHAAALAEAGVNRASLGVQSFDPEVQRAVNRVQSFEETSRVVDWLRFAGVAAINLDLMYGLPHQMVENVTMSVTRSLALDPDRIALFGYAHVPWMKRHQALLPETALPDSRARLAQFEAAAERIVDAGYIRIGLDHFARPDDPLARAGALHRNFQGYTTDDAPVLIGFGASAISNLPQGYAQNAASVVDYRAAIETGRLPTARGVALSADDRLRRDIIMRLMCDLTVDLDDICRRHGASTDRFSSELARIDELEREGLARRDGARIDIPADARTLSRVACATFDRYFSEAARRHSLAV